MVLGASKHGNGAVGATTGVTPPPTRTVAGRGTDVGRYLGQR